MGRWVRSLACASVLTGCASANPVARGIQPDGRLAPCPDSPNCVWSQATDERHHIEPLTYTSSLETARGRLQEAIEGFPRTRTVTSEATYLHVEFTSWLFRFVDDVEFYLNADDNTIEVRSASRKGYYDFGVNRKRVEDIRKRLNAVLSKQKSETEREDT